MEKESTNQSSKLSLYETPAIWGKFSRLAVLTGSANVGQGFPDWKTTDFFLETIQKHITLSTSNHQYTRSFGSVKLVESIAKNYSSSFNRELKAMSEILVGNGAVNLLYVIITSLIEQGDEMVAIEPFYDCYLPQVVFSGGKIVGVPLIPPQKRERKEYYNITNGKVPKDIWEIDWEKFENSFNEKTKILILNTPNNPTGKILTIDELKKIQKILEKFPKVVVIMDEVYEHMIYDEYDVLHRMASLEGIWEKTIAECLEIVNLPYKNYDTYYKWLRAEYTKQRAMVIESLSQLDKFGLAFWVPEGGYFILADITHVENTKKYKFEDEEEQENKYSKDFNYILNMAHERKVVGIPCSAFYTQENKHIGSNYIRLAFCKKDETHLKI